MKVILKMIKKKEKEYFNNGDIYEGDWKNDNRTGKGIYYFKSGNRYEGDFKNGKKEGKGIFYYNNGNRYEGDFKNDKYEGKGIFYFNNRDRQMGDFLNDKRIISHFSISIILIMEKDMKVIGKMIKKKEKEYIIIIMVIEKWEII